MNESPKYALLVPSSLGVRLTPCGGFPAHAATSFDLQVTSAETNAASVASFLGLPVKVLTALVESHPFSARIEADLRGRGMDVEAMVLPQGSPWGWRHQINIADSGSGLRGPRVWNDRAGEAGRALKADAFDLERIFGREGVRMVHLSGLVAAIAPEFCTGVVRCAREHGAAVSFDLNYRASFWEGRQEELRAVFMSITSLSDVLIGNEEDFQLCLGLEGPETGGQGLAGKTEAFKAMLADIRSRFPAARVVATTLREVLDSGRHLWGAIVSDASGTEILEPREISVLDRIGGGDGFVGGLLYGLLKGWDTGRCTRFAWACGVLAVNLPTDYAIPAGEEQLWAIWNGNARVKR